MVAPGVGAYALSWSTDGAGCRSIGATALVPRYKVGSLTVGTPHTRSVHLIRRLHGHLRNGGASLLLSC
jgi:hypothetical protein